MRVRLPEPPKSAFPHSMTYSEFSGKKNADGKPEVLLALNITGVRYDAGAVYTVGSKDASIKYNGVIFTHWKYSKGVPSAFAVGSQVECNGKTLKVMTATPLYFPDGVEIHHWEIGVQ